MTIQLSEAGQEFVRSLVEDGSYPSAEDVIEEALKLLEDRENQTKLESLRREIAIGIEEADRGELGPFDPMATLARVRARLDDPDAPLS